MKQRCVKINGRPSFGIIPRALMAGFRGGKEFYSIRQRDFNSFLPLSVDLWNDFKREGIATR